MCDIGKIEAVFDVPEPLVVSTIPGTKPLRKITEQPELEPVISKPVPVETREVVYVRRISGLVSKES